MESAARMNQNKTVFPHLPFHSLPNGDTIIIHHSPSFFNFHAFVVENIQGKRVKIGKEDKK